MIVSYSKNPFKQIVGIAYWNRWTLLFFTFCAGLAYTLCIYFKVMAFEFPPVSVAILGSALAIFLGFRNSSAYDRWWEARKVWGSIVNNSRSLGLELMTYPIGNNEQDQKEISKWQERMIKRQIGWLEALKGHLRKDEIDLAQYLSNSDLNKIKGKANLPAQILVLQGGDIDFAFRQGWIEEFRFNALIATLKKFYDNQGMAERIKNTIFPFYYNYFTLFFLWLFTTILPFTLAGLMNHWLMIPLSVLISFAFFILNKSGVITETPFDGVAADTPISTISRSIEIDLLQMLDTDEVPSMVENTKSKFGVVYQN
ncbi:MAG: hypothetical protein MK066_06620 [Crocinitomicaceae bacterium]|nr:hypothetical protein [Crocinitomicaceae bacterium]